ncbi:MAG: BON domain-containing protein [Magnetovibrio sp.]|nr:BON domain-containing protein [Magnetovibrio sp.]
MFRKSPLLCAATVLILLGVQACGPLSFVLGAGAATGIAAYQERGVDGVARDLRTSSQVFDLFARTDHLLLTNIGVEVYEGRVLLTGQVETETMRAEAVRLAWTANGTLDVLNEIHVTQLGGILDTAHDVWITAQLSTRLTFDKRVFAINYAIETVGGIVYLIGIAQNQDELDRVINQARAIPYVLHIINHVRIKDPLSSPPASAVQPTKGVLN